LRGVEEKRRISTQRVGGGEFIDYVIGCIMIRTKFVRMVLFRDSHRGTLMSKTKFLQRRANLHFTQPSKLCFHLC